MTWRFDFPLRNYDFKYTQLIYGVHVYLEQWTG